jgi:pimeloyl-ACP methyl ester carboxylesterase
MAGRPRAADRYANRSTRRAGRGRRSSPASVRRTSVPMPRDGYWGEPVVLLHGFPETARMWTTLMERLADEGYHCLAPDQRGYSPGTRPGDVDRYNYEDLATDVQGLAAAARFERFHLVGHDRGAIVGWAQLAIDDKRIRSWTSLSIPHYRAWAQALLDNPFWRGQSWLRQTYALAVSRQRPILPCVRSRRSPSPLPVRQGTRRGCGATSLDAIRTTFTSSSTPVSSAAPNRSACSK